MDIALELGATGALVAAVLDRRVGAGFVAGKGPRTHDEVMAMLTANARRACWRSRPAAPTACAWKDARRCTVW